MNNPELLLSEKISDKTLDALKVHKNTEAWLKLAELAVPAVIRAATGGNVGCREALKLMAPTILEICPDFFKISPSPVPLNSSSHVTIGKKSPICSVTSLEE